MKTVGHITLRPALTLSISVREDSPDLPRAAITTETQRTGMTQTIEITEEGAMLHIALGALVAYFCMTGQSYNDAVYEANRRLFPSDGDEASSDRIHSLQDAR